MEARRSPTGFWDALSSPDPYQKMHPAMEPNSGMQLPLAAYPESPSHSKPQLRGALLIRQEKGPTPAIREQAFTLEQGYPRSHISANEINLASPLFAAASWHPRVKPRFEKIA